MKYAIVLMTLAVCISGCNPAPSDGKSTAPDVQQYTKLAQQTADIEISGGQCPMLSSFALDYLNMRDQTRVLKGEQIQ